MRSWLLHTKAGEKLFSDCQCCVCSGFVCLINPWTSWRLDEVHYRVWSTTYPAQSVSTTSFKSIKTNLKAIKSVSCLSGMGHMVNPSRISSRVRVLQSQLELSANHYSWASKQIFKPSVVSNVDMVWTTWSAWLGFLIEPTCASCMLGSYASLSVCLKSLRYKNAIFKFAFWAWFIWPSSRNS